MDIVEFGDVRFDRRSGDVLRAGRLATLTPKAAAVLAVLVEQAPELVSKEKLLERVWDAKAVGEEALTSCIQEVRRALDDDARRPRYVETRHRRGYRLIVPLARSSSSASAAAVSQRPGKPSLAVLPFDNLSADPQQEYFADGIVEDITIALSRIGFFFVVARGSSFTFKNTNLRAEEIGRRLGVRYLVEGSIQRAGARLRLTAQVVETETGHHIWADRYDGELHDVFDLQDRLVTSVVGAISPTIRAAEIERARLKRPESLQAYDHVLRGYPGFWSLMDPAHEEATGFFHKAFELEPGYALAMALAAWCHAQRFIRIMADGPEEHRRQAIELANGALAIAPDDPGVLIAAGGALLIAGRREDIARCEILFRKALLLDPNSAPGWRRMGFLHVHRSQADQAIEAFEQSIALSPLDPMRVIGRFGIGDAHFAAGRLREALTRHRECLAERPRDPVFRRRVCALLALLGELEEARRMASELLTDHPHLTLERIALANTGLPYFESFLEGLRRAGFS